MNALRFEVTCLIVLSIRFIYDALRLRPSPWHVSGDNANVICSFRAARDAMDAHDRTTQMRLASLLFLYITIYKKHIEVYFKYSIAFPSLF